MFKHILVAVDGSANAREAARTAGNLARELGARVYVVVAFEPIPDYLGEPFWEEAANARMKKAETILSAALGVVGDVPGGVETEMLEGRPAEAILKVAESRDVDLIVMGAQGEGSLGSWLLGSQSRKVINHAPCPVLIVR